jgi:hypothetical protein
MDSFLKPFDVGRAIRGGCDADCFAVGDGAAGKAKATRNAPAGIPSWVLFAVLTALGIASLIFGLFNPELIAATFYEG